MDEAKQLREEILKYTDADQDGTLSYPAHTNARAQVIEKMVESLPLYHYISGGKHTVDRMKFHMRQSVMDENRDGLVDRYELEAYVARMIVLREATVRTPRSHQFRIMMDEAMMDPVMRYSARAERERQKLAQDRWRRRGLQQQKDNWFEIEARKRVMRVQAEREIAEVAREAERDRLRRQAQEKLSPEGYGEKADPQP